MKERDEESKVREQAMREMEERERVRDEENNAREQAMREMEHAMKEMEERERVRDEREKAREQTMREMEAKMREIKEKPNEVFGIDVTDKSRPRRTNTARWWSVDSRPHC